MAYVSIRWGQNASYHLNYATKDRAPSDETYVHDCSAETAISDFESVRAEHNKEGGNEVLHVIQSFSISDSFKMDVSAFCEMGKSLARENFPGHQYVLRTHTDTDKIHNHIVINTVNSETGKKIENKRALIFRLQDSSDRMCLEKGLSVITRGAKEPGAKLPFKVQQMVKAGKTSYIFDITQKADVARSIATNFDEYRDTMGAFNIRVLIEDKNISYFYPGRELGKRGSKLGRAYDKDGLSERFAANTEKFARNPDLKARFQSQVVPIQKCGMPKTPDGISKLRNLWSGKDTAWAVPAVFPSISRRTSKDAFQSDNELRLNFVPAEDIKQARSHSIFEYCKSNNISLIKNAKGETVFKGKEFVTVSEFEFTNTKNNTRGSLIDLVAAHKNMTLLQSIAHINKNPRMLLLEKQIGKINLHYKSFHVPKPSKGTAQQIASKLQGIFQSGDNKSHSVSERFLERKISRSGQAGAVWIFGDKSKPSSPSGEISTSSSAQHEKSLFTLIGVQEVMSFFTIDHPTERTIDQFLIENQSVKKINFVAFHDGKTRFFEDSFLSILQKKYSAFGIEVNGIHNEKSLEKYFEIEPRAPDRSRGRGGPDIGF